MFRNGVIYTMNFYIRLGIILFILLAGLIADIKDPLYESIESNLKKYRQSITTDDVTFKNGIIRIEINGRRTNIKSQLLLGFYSIGRALQRNSTPFREVQIVIYYEVKESQEVMAKASIKNVLDLSHGRLSLEQFFAIIEY